MATIAQWEREIKRTGDKELKEVARAIGQLLSWEFFAQEFGGMGLRMLKHEIEAERDNRALGTSSRGIKRAVEAVIMSDWFRLRDRGVYLASWSMAVGGYRERVQRYLDKHNLTVSNSDEFPWIHNRLS